MAKDFLRERRIKFEEIDIERDPAAAREMIRKSGQMGVPVLIIDKKVIVGFDEVAIKRALRLK
jgi:glutaredoxin